MKSDKTNSIEIIFDLNDFPDTSKIMQELVKKGYDQNLVDINMPKVKFSGQYTGSVNDLIGVMDVILKKIDNRDSKE